MNKNSNNVVNESIVNYISENHPEALVMDGYDDCIIGTVEIFGKEPLVCYDKTKVLKNLEKQGMSEEESVEWFYFNQMGAYLGERTPCFLTQL
jgi:hypothetical protein